MDVGKNLFLVFLINHLLLLKADSECPKSFPCGHLGSLEFPFSQNPECGLFVADCHSESPKLEIGMNWYNILQKNSTNKFLLSHPQLQMNLIDRSCSSFQNLSLPQSPFVSFTFSPNLTFFTCSDRTPKEYIEKYFQNYRRVDCKTPHFIRHPTVYYRNSVTGVPATDGSSIPSTCSLIQLPTRPDKDKAEVFNFDLLTAEFNLEWNISEACYDCYHRGGRCLSDQMNKFYCKQADCECPKSFPCGHLGSLDFPFSQDPRCGLFVVDDCDSQFPRVQLGPGGYWYNIWRDIPTNKLRLSDPQLQGQLTEKSCFSFRNLSLPQSPFVSFTFSPNLTLFTCFNQTPDEQIQDYFQNYHGLECGPPHLAPHPSTVYYRNSTTHVPDTNEISIPPKYCSLIQLPEKPNQDKGDLFDLLTAEFTLEWNVSEACSKCHLEGGQCDIDTPNHFYCRKEGKNRMTLILSISLSGAGVLLLLAVTYIVWLHKKRNKGGYLLSRNISSGPSSKSDIEGGSLCFGIPIFSYTELEEATSNFDPSKELGDGGFGTVYYGKLGDGREVAIKRLYEHNYRRVEQFLNEIRILTGLRHPNLVSLYGCTSRRSRELLLVYEYIPNGTVADHLHGERANEAPLSWPVRMSIAIETATALSYLHNSDIIHRDVKTNNILLDNNFCVKVADFGLSRLFPTNVTHISTAPQGTPGYVDPEYHECYQLTDKSDVYSFGVVLIELISSMPAVDISRHRHEINLADLAVDRIQRCAFDELIDPSLGYKSDAEVTRMTTSVAELAFRCLQLEKDMRPSMEEVLAFLKDIQGGEDCNAEQIKEANGSHSVPGKIPPSAETDNVVLMKNKNFQSSPTAVTDKWASSGSTAASSTG